MSKFESVIPKDGKVKLSSSLRFTSPNQKTGILKILSFVFWTMMFSSFISALSAVIFHTSLLLQEVTLIFLSSKFSSLLFAVSNERFI